MNISPKAIYETYSKAIRNPKYRYWIILGTLVYILSPIDLSPDVFPIVGQIDDFLLFSLMITEVSQMLISSYKNKKGQETEASDGQTIDVDAVSTDA